MQKEWLKVCEKFSSWYNLYATVFGLSSGQSLSTLAGCHLYFTLSQMTPAEKEVEEQQQAEEIQRQKEQAELEQEQRCKAKDLSKKIKTKRRDVVSKKDELQKAVDSLTRLETAQDTNNAESSQHLTNTPGPSHIPTNTPTLPQPAPSTPRTSTPSSSTIVPVDVLVNNYLQTPRPVPLNSLNSQVKQELDFLADLVREKCAKAIDEHGLTAQGLKNIKAMVRSMLQLYVET